jgi:hypothetical protein
VVYIALAAAAMRFRRERCLGCEESHAGFDDAGLVGEHDGLDAVTAFQLRERCRRGS